MRETRVLTSGTLVTSAGEQKVLVRELSRFGAQIYAGRGIASGQDACFSKGTLFVAGRVISCDRGDATLKFYRELTLPELETTVVLARPTIPPTIQA